jgi:hypothetical protein
MQVNQPQSWLAIRADSTQKIPGMQIVMHDAGSVDGRQESRP